METTPQPTIGELLTPTLVKIEETLLECNVKGLGPLLFPVEALRASCMIFDTILMDFMFELQQKEKMSLEDCCKMAENAGKELRLLVKKYTNIDTHDFYK